MSFTQIDKGNAGFFLSAEGPFASSSVGYEERPSQIELTECIADAFNREKIGVFEAGTGVGKSFAYLIPSFLWAEANDERVIVSTGTKSLQQQLIEKDIPAAESITGKHIKAVLLKGRQNYICLRRLSDAEDEKNKEDKGDKGSYLFDDFGEELSKISEFSQKTKDGDRSSLSFNPHEDVWSRIKSDSDSCFGRRCMYYDKCFVMKARKEAEDANLIVVNHHLLFADVESRMNSDDWEEYSVLPPFRRVILDEAHGVEDSATSFFSESMSSRRILRQASLLYRKGRGTISGYLVQAASLSNVENWTERVIALTEGLKSSLISLDEISLSVLSEGGSERIHVGNSSRFSNVFTALKKTEASLLEFSEFVGEVIDGIDKDYSDIAAVTESKLVAGKIHDFACLCADFCNWQEEADRVFSLQARRTQGKDATAWVEFNKTPIGIAQLMLRFFSEMRTVVCTSATLRMGTSFTYWLERFGLSEKDSRVMTGFFASPFPYKENMLFAVPSDAPFPNSMYYHSFVESGIPRLILAAKGRTLVLFTSYESLRHACTSSRKSLAESGIDILCQGEDDNSHLLDQFRSDTKSVLFATSSFWEGVDVPGKSLSQVIIVKLPFPVPSEPVFEARSEALERKGINSFMGLSVPQAVIRFRQGIGRLIRRTDDRGVVVVLDRRIIEQRYGYLFTDSMPETKRLYSPLSEILNEIKSFI